MGGVEILHKQVKITNMLRWTICNTMAYIFGCKEIYILCAPLVLLTAHPVNNALTIFRISNNIVICYLYIFDVIPKCKIVILILSQLYFEFM